MVLRNLLILFIVIPLIELFVLIKLGELWGAAPTIGLVIITGVAGAMLTKMQGLLIIRQIKDDMHAGQMPADKLVDGLLILIGGALLLTPGLLTDIVGFICIIPWTRIMIKTQIKNKIKEKMLSGDVQIHTNDTFY